MSESSISAGQRDRSPAYPIIPLGEALQRLVAFESHFKRGAARPEKVGDAWGIKAKAYTDRTVAALRYFGLLDYQVQSGVRSVVVSEEGRKYLRAQQDDVKREVITAAALRPKQIAKYWNEWGTDRPADAACLDELVLNNGFSEKGARDFLKVYDATISFAKLDHIAIVAPTDFRGNPDDEEEVEDDQSPPPLRSSGGRSPTVLMQGERVLTTGMLSKGANFKLIVDGPIGVKEIERLISKLEFDKEILADADDDSDLA